MIGFDGIGVWSFTLYTLFLALRGQCKCRASGILLTSSLHGRTIERLAAIADPPVPTTIRYACCSGVLQTEFKNKV